MTIRIDGMVAAARRAQEQMQAGFLPEARSRFLARIAGIVRKVDMFCARHGARPEDLPSPSQNALAVLRKIAATPEGDLPAPRDGAVPIVALRISNVVATLDRCLDSLAVPSPDSEVLSRVRLRVEACIRAVEAICRERGATAAALPDRSRRAYAMLRWLSTPGNLDRYVEQARTARVILTDLLREMERPPCDGMHVSFRRDRKLYQVQWQEPMHDIRLHVGYLAAGVQELRDLALVIVFRRDVSTEIRARYQSFVESEDFGEMEQEIDLLVGGVCHQPKGLTRDLDVLFARVNEQFFDGRMEKPALHWSVTVARQQFGSYIASRDLVSLNPLLDDPDVPEFVTEYVLYHELLHKKHGTRIAGRRRHVHTPAFRADEARFPRYGEADAWLGALAQGKAAPPRQGAPDVVSGDENGDVDLPTGTGAPGAPRSLPRAAAPAPPLPAASKVGRNHPCPCGSGRKYKRCCGR